MKNFAYDDENQLIAVSVANSWSNSFAYDGLMRKRIERDYSWNAGTASWQQTNEVHFIYDGNLVIQERYFNLQLSTQIPLNSITYTRGNDLSGSLQDAGGIGGLLARTDNGQMMVGDPNANAYYFSDAQGNVTALVAPSGMLLASYKYDPYGNMISMSGPMADANKYRFSSKEWNENAGLYYYGYRFYDPNLQRWPNRDPLGDAGSLILLGPSLDQDDEPDEVSGTTDDELLDAWAQINLNVSAFTLNNPLNSIDPYGLCMLDTAANFAAGVGDNLTFGLTDMARESLGWNEGVNKNSGAYKAGDDTTTGVQMATGIPGIVKTAAKKGLEDVAKKVAEKEIKKVRDAEDAINKAKDIAKAQDKAKKARQSIQGPDAGDWEGAKSRPKQNSIDNTSKSEQRAKNCSGD